MFPTPRHGFAIATIVILLCCLTPATRAQWGGPAFNPRFTSGDLERAATVLELTDVQLGSIKELHEAYLAEFGVACQKMRTYMEEYQKAVQDQPANDHTWDEWSETWQRFEKHGDTLGEQFVNDLKLALTPAQLERWPRVEWRLYRQKNIGSGWLAAERVDLVQIIEELKLSPDVSSRIEPILFNCERELDPALKARQDFMLHKLEEARKLWDAKDLERLSAYYREGREVCIRVRDLNLRTMRLISAELPSDLNQKFLASFNSQAFGDVYAPTQAETLIRAARDIEGLTPEQRDQVETLSKTLDGGLRAARERWAAALLKHESDRTIQVIMAEETSGTDPFKDQREAIEALSKRMLDRLKEVLPPEQAEKLPGMGRPKNLPKVDF